MQTRLLNVLAFFVFVPGISSAQAWLLPKGEGAMSLTYQYVSYPGHLNFLGKRFPVGSSLVQTAFFEMEYSITDKAAVTLSLPFVATKYTGARPFVTGCGPLFDTHSDADDGNWHGTVQDFNLGLRYNVARTPLLVTPFLRVVLPSHEYIADGEAAFGRNLRELQFGTSLGRRLDPFLNQAYAHATFSYAFVEAPLDVPLDRTNIALEFGYFVSSSVAVRSFGTYQKTHGGFPRVPCTPDLFQVHDRLLRDNNWRGGAGISYLLNQSLGIDASYVRVISGSSSHYGSGVSIGLNWVFGQGLNENTVIAAKGVPFTESQQVVFCSQQ